MNKGMHACIFSVCTTLAVLTMLGLVMAGDFTLQGEGRDTDLMSMEKSVVLDKDLKIIITGNHPYRSESKGKFSLYTEKRTKIKEVRFALQPGETKSWEYPADQKIKLIGIGVYGKGEIKVILQQEESDSAQVASEAEPPAKEVVAKSPEAVPGSFPLLLKEAEKSYVDGNKLEAMLKLEQAALDIRDEIPLTVKNVRLVEDTETYVTRKNNIFASGEKMHINSQIYGYKLKQVGGAYSINIITDVYFLQDGEILTGQQDFGKFDIISPIPDTSFRLDLTYWLSDASPGIYDIQTVLHDQNSGQSTKFTTQVEMK